MNDERLPSREGGARPRVRGGRSAARRIPAAVVFLAGIIAAIARTAVAVVADSQQLSPLGRRLSAVAAFVLELEGDPARALTTVAIVATVSCAIAAWRRSAAAGAFVFATMMMAIDEGFVPAREFAARN